MGKCISILGSTGSIGTQSLEVAKAHDMQVHALAANRNITLLDNRHGNITRKRSAFLKRASIRN